MMKKVNVKVFACLMAGALMMNSCIGSFSLFNKYAEWQRTMTNSKFLNAIVGFILMPIVGGITWVIDWFVLNTIEFWSGDNPMAKNAGKTQQVMGSDGRYYAVKTLIDGYEITTPDGQMVKFVYDKQNDAWMQVQNGVTKEMFRFNEDGTVKVNTPEGPKDVALNEAGLYQVQMACSGNNFWACR
ncbi:MAG: DUF3332 domain-containing protein [Prevotella sp.]|jgi:hypothetical protein|nr:DUF3332 domain-containing protein [Prevotella sp.]